MINTKTQSRNRRRRLVAKKCCTPSIFLQPRTSGDSGEHQPIQEPPPSTESGSEPGGRGPNREGYHSMTDRLIGEGHSPEPRTSEVDTPKAAIAQEVEIVQLHGKVIVEDDIAKDESSAIAVIEVKKQLMKDGDGQSLTQAKTTRVNLGNGARSLSPLDVHDREKSSLSPLGQSAGPEDWVEVEITVDSGACDTVMPTSWCTHISIQQTAESKAGMEYEVANGETIPNVGERRCLLMSEDSHIMKKITFQCADIHKPLLSVSRCADLGFDCVLEATGGRLVDKVTGEAIPLHRRGNLYTMRAWIRQDSSTPPASDFGRQR